MTTFKKDDYVYCIKGKDTIPGKVLKVGRKFLTVRDGQDIFRVSKSNCRPQE